MKLASQIKPISYLKAHAAEIVRNLGDQREPLIITQNGEAKAVLLDLAEYEQDQESLALLKMIAQSKKAYTSGQFKTAKKVFSDIKKNIKDMQN